uniref:Bm8449 n=1 Tax=Brugia malayi TaxID=6279 RepID=A0A1I9G8Z8_BRUMA|nr:Bm8449 [Brugia malayi]
MRRRLKRISSKSFNFSNTLSSINSEADSNNKFHCTEQQAQISLAPHSGNSPLPPLLLNQQFIFLNDNIVGIVTQRQWTTSAAQSSSINCHSKSKSVMSAKVETTVRQWSTPIEKVVEGQPPKPVSYIENRLALF